MDWNKIIEGFLKNAPAFSEEVGIVPNATTETKTKCCGVDLGWHITWTGAWRRCNPSKKAAWTRKKNREEKIRKQAEKLRALGVCSLPGHDEELKK